MNTTTTPATPSEAPQAPSLPPKSRTLLRLEKNPATVCATCPNALWQSLQIKGKPGVRVYCTLMGVLVDDLLTDCDGMPDELTAN